LCHAIKRNCSVGNYGILSCRSRGGIIVKQFFGYLIIIAFFPLLYLLGEKIWEEVDQAKTQQQQIEEQVQLPETQTQLPVRMLDRNGSLFNEDYVEWRVPTPLNEMPEIVKQLFILSEDRDFYQHIGFDFSAIMRAVIANAGQNSIRQGGSTITQQLVRSLYLSEEKTYERKLMEIFYAYELEKMYDKDKILEMYLNEMYFANQVYGIGGAATYYFNKPLQDLSVAEIAFISAIPNNPSLYDPVTNFGNTKARQERLIDLLAKENIITADEANTYKNEPIRLNIKRKTQKFPAYSTYVLHELKELIAENEGYADRLRKATPDAKKVVQKELDERINELLHSGIIIHTALNPQKQDGDEKAIDSFLSVQNNLQASAVVIDNSNREIVSIYGGKDYKKFDFHRAYQAPRQPGSSFKPLIVYAPLFETANYSPSSIVSGGNICIGNFCPQNYGGAVYGNVTIATAFKYSLNTAALRLFTKVGIDTAFQYLNQFRFESIEEKDKNYSAALGGLTYGVTALEMADAYTSFIDGSYTRAHAIRKVTDQDGNILYQWPTERKQIWSEQTVQYMRTLLGEVVRSGTGKGIFANSSYIGAKTGTTNDYRDFWLAGLSNEYTAAVWLGYDQPKSMQQLEKAQIHFKIFNRIMNQ